MGGIGMKRLVSLVLVIMLTLSCVPAFAASGITDEMTVVKCKEWVSLRKTASTKAERLDMVPLGATVTGCKASGTNWVKCSYDGKTGYILKSYLKGTAPSPTPIADQKIINCNSWVSLRKTASTTATRLAEVPKGTVVTNCEKSGSWVKCTYNGKTGYIKATYLTNATEPTPKISDTMVVVNVSDFASLRKEAKSSAARVTTIPLGASVTGCAYVGNGYVSCNYGGKFGYVLAKYLKTTSGESPIADQKVVKCNEWVSLRASASSGAARLVKIPLDAVVTNCVSYGSWVKCSYKGKTGYVMAKYLTNAN